MLNPLNTQQQQWVETTLAAMSLEECAGQLLCPSLPRFTTADWLDLLKKVPLGCMFIRNMPQDELRQMMTAIQAHSPIPILVAGDLEHGAQAVQDEGTVFPWLMAAGATNNAELMAAMGRATAVEARYAGLHWTFGPVVDLNYNFNNPITNIRALSDEPERVMRLAPPFIRGLQENGRLAATAKHFPGDGVDDRDQHLVTSVNSLPFSQWQETYGQVWTSVIKAGVMSIMAGHISLPDYQGFTACPDDAPPATLSQELLLNLLRQELGFEGLIVSDASPMIGLTSRVPASERILRNLAAGVDVYLFPDPIKDFAWLIQGVRDGRLSEERIRQSTRRVLALKARLNLPQDPFGPPPSDAQKRGFQQAAQDMADKSITVMRGDGRPPLQLPSGARVLTVTIGQLNQFMGQKDLETFDLELRRRGYQVDHLLNPENDELRDKVVAYDLVFINLFTTPMMVLGTIRTVVGGFRSWGWRSIFVDNPHVVFTSFGNPYTLYEMPHIPNLVAAYGDSEVSQRAAVKVWLGEIEPQGDCPVELPRVVVKPWPTGS
ncbi:MAG: hypothetical protein JW953_16535 [Anaerolineae bacterium]|nr:hypothetical protein [Anaerolineae bacterium]